MSTPDAASVRRKLFEALGGTVTRGAWDDVMHGYAWTATWPGGSDLEWLPAETADEYWQQLEHSLTTAVPNWPADDGEALALCLDIARRHEWFITIGDDYRGDIFAHFMDGNEFEYGSGYGDTPALALSRLALAALEDEVQP